MLRFNIIEDMFIDNLQVIIIIIILVLIYSYICINIINTNFELIHRQ